MTNKFTWKLGTYKCSQEGCPNEVKGIVNGYCKDCSWIPVFKRWPFRLSGRKIKIIYSDEEQTPRNTTTQTKDN